MSPHEQGVLEDVRREYSAAKVLLTEALAQDRSNPDLALTSRHLEITYLLRAYAGFEGLLRSRSGNMSRRATLVTHINTILAGKAQATFDPATNYRNTVGWSLLMTRDRNSLAHGLTTIPAMSIHLTINTMELFLRSF